MRFIVCARDRQTGAVTLVSQSAFPNRRQAVEAIIASTQIDALLASDVFLVDLEVAVPVALVPVSDSGAVPQVRVDLLQDSGEAAAGPEPEPSFEDSADTDTEVDEERAADTPGEAVHLDVLEIDIASWTCEDCIYVQTCDKSGTLRPVDCGSFQWRA